MTSDTTLGLAGRAGLLWAWRIAGHVQLRWPKGKNAHMDRER